MKIQNGIAIICFFLSGFAGLVYEVSWIRKAALVFGSTTFAVSTVLAVFFSGWLVEVTCSDELVKGRCNR